MTEEELETEAAGRRIGRQREVPREEEGRGVMRPALRRREELITEMLEYEDEEITDLSEWED